MRYTREKTDKHEPHWWFAWYPVRVSVATRVERDREVKTSTWVWLERVRSYVDIYGRRSVLEPGDKGYLA